MFSEKYRRNSKRRKSKKNFSCYVKGLINKYGKNSKNTFFKILHLQLKRKGPEGFREVRKFRKNRKSNGKFSC